MKPGAVRIASTSFGTTGLERPDHGRRVPQPGRLDGAGRAQRERRPAYVRGRRRRAAVRLLPARRGAGDVHLAAQRPSLRRRLRPAAAARARPPPRSPTGETPQARRRRRRLDPVVQPAPRRRPGQYLQVDLGGAADLPPGRLDTGGSTRRLRPRLDRCQVSDDGSRWRTLASGTGTGQLTTVDVPRTHARYLRVISTGSAATGGASPTSGSTTEVHRRQQRTRRVAGVDRPRRRRSSGSARCVDRDRLGRATRADFSIASGPARAGRREPTSRSTASAAACRLTLVPATTDLAAVITASARRTQEARARGIRRHHRGWRLGRRGAGGAAVGGTGPPRPAAGGGPGLRDRRVNPSRSRRRLAHVVAGARLGADRRGRARPGHSLSAWPGDRRLLRRQRHDRPARRARGLRRVGGAGQRRVELGEGVAALPPAGRRPGGARRAARARRPGRHPPLAAATS